MRSHLFLPLVCASICAAVASPALADVTFNADARMFYDNNVNGSPTGANQLGDRYLSLGASATYFKPLDADQTRYFIGQVGANSATFSKYNNLDNTGLMASAGLYQQLSAAWSVQLTGRGFGRNTKQSDRNSSGLGGTLELKNQLSSTLWVKGVVDYEDSKANLATYSYTGTTFGVNLGYLPLEKTFINVGYSQARRDFKSVLPFNSTTQTLFADLSQQIAKNWYLNFGYSHGRNDSNIPGTAYNNRVLSAGLSFSY